MKYNKKLAESDRLRELKRFQLEQTQQVEGWGLTAPTISQESGLSGQVSDTDAIKRCREEKAQKQLNFFYHGKVPQKPQTGKTTIVGAVENADDNNNNGEEATATKSHSSEVEINAFDFLQSEAEENIVVCPSWQMPLNEYSYCEPGCIGFNGHQAIFHCYKPGQASLRGGCTDKCTLKLSTLPSGAQICTVVYETPPAPKLKFPPKEVCITDRQEWVDFEDLCAIPPEPVPEVPPSPKKKGGKGGKGGKKGKKK